MDNTLNRIQKALGTTAELSVQLMAEKSVLKDYQSRTLKARHADMFANPETRMAAEFFVREIYGPNSNLNVRDLRRVIPSMQKVLPSNILEVVAVALELQALTETLDTQMAQILGLNFTPEQYQTAFESINPEQRLMQLSKLEFLGKSLITLVRLPFIGQTLKIMALPARLAGLTQLHNFLTQGYEAFKALKHPEDFIRQLVEIEKQNVQKKTV